MGLMTTSHLRHNEKLRIWFQVAAPLSVHCSLLPVAANLMRQTTGVSLERLP